MCMGMEALKKAAEASKMQIEAQDEKPDNKTTASSLRATSSGVDKMPRRIEIS